MELGEAVGVGITAMEKEKDPSCDKQDEDKGWKSRVNDYNSQEKCTGTRLYDNMKGVASAHESKGLGVVPDKKAGTQWKLSMVTERTFPIQAHHLIPKNYLPDHLVVRFLAIKYKKDAMFELKYDSNYDTDDADNGYCMPYATPMEEWKGDQSEKTAVAFKVMKQTGIQLHQGSHATVLDAEKLKEMAGEVIVPDITEPAADGDTDEMEEARIHEPGYLNRVGLLLDVVDQKAFAHASGGCTICGKQMEGKKALILPSEAVVQLMHRVSAIIKILIDGNAAHVSGYAYYYAYHKRDIKIKDGKVHIRGTKKELKKKLGI